MKTSWLDRWWFATDQSQDVAPRLDGGGWLSYAMAPMALRYPVVVRRERKRKIALIARYAPALARRVERRELSPEKAIRQVAHKLIRKSAA